MSPYKDAILSKDRQRAITIDDILQDDIPCAFQLDNGERREARGQEMAQGSYSCTTLRPGLQFLTCNLKMGSAFDVTTVWPACLHLTSLISGGSAAKIEGDAYVHPVGGVPQVVGLGQETEIHSLESCSDDVRMAGLMVTPEFFETLSPDLEAGLAPLQRLLASGARCHDLPQAEQLRHILKRMHHMPFDGAIGTLYLESLGTVAMIELAAHLSGGALTQADADGRKHRLAAEARARIEDAPESITSTQALAHDLGTNETTLRSRFKEVYGVSVMDHLRDVRLRRARRDIRSGTRQISEVAYACGYAHPANFTHAYRKRFGRSPREDSPHFR